MTPARLAPLFALVAAAACAQPGPERARTPTPRAAKAPATTVPAEPESTRSEAERVRAAKALTLDRKYAEARQAWTAILSRARGPAADEAAYWIARSSELLGEHERSFNEYGTFLARRPQDRSTVEEARTSRIGLATKLYRGGQRSYATVLQEGLTDPSKTVRYYAALQLGGLGAPNSREALPVLQQILAHETDADLLDRVRIVLLKLDPRSLSGPVPSAGRAGPPARMLRVRVYERGQAKPKVSVNVPVALAEILFDSLPPDAKGELKRKGYDSDNFWPRLKALGPTEVIDIEGDAGERIKVWLE
jgi:hypothetical protein